MLHILALTLCHLAAITLPGTFRRNHNTIKASRLDMTLVACLWAGPSALFLVIFAANADRTFLSPDCSAQLLLSAPFRALVISAVLCFSTLRVSSYLAQVLVLVLVPLASIILAYGAMVWQLRLVRNRLLSHTACPRRAGGRHDPVYYQYQRFLPLFPHPPSSRAFILPRLLPCPPVASQLASEQSA